jgi:N-acyl-D-amino-acid deacylase
VRTEIRVRERRLLTLEDAVREMTSFPARRSRLGRRGIIAPGYAADLVVFDPETVSDRATYEEPKRPPEGIHLVLVGGEKTFEDGAYLGARNGAVLRQGGGYL